MREGLRQSMAWLHAWSGLLVCWVLFLVFCGGTASYFRNEITFWMKPELHLVPRAELDTAQAAQAAIVALQRRAPDAMRWFISLPDERSGALQIGWISSLKSGAQYDSAVVDAVSGDDLRTVRHTRGGEFFYRLHFDLHYMPAIWARWIVGTCAMFMLVAIVSGIITHKRIFQDCFTFRPRKGQRSWLDAHNATAVLALPFHLMITYTGLVTMMFMYMPWPAQTVYKGDQTAFYADVFPNGRARAASGQAAALTALAPLVTRAEHHWQGMPANFITVDNPGDAHATIAIARHMDKSLSYLQPVMQFDGLNGALMEVAGEQPGAANRVRGAMYGLHMAHFANPLLRSLFFLCGLSGCAMVATGALLWGVKERQKYAKTIARGGRVGFGVRLVDALNIGTIAGVPIAFATYFWANRLLPVAMEHRADIEIRYFFAAWAIAAIAAQIRPDRRMWQAQLWLCAILWIGIPLLNALTTSSHLGVTLLLGRGPWQVAGFDLTVLALGCGFALAAWHLGRKDKRAHVSHPSPASANETAQQPFQEMP